MPAGAPFGNEMRNEEQKMGNAHQVERSDWNSGRTAWAERAHTTGATGRRLPLGRRTAEEPRHGENPGIAAALIVLLYFVVLVARQIL